MGCRWIIIPVKYFILWANPVKTKYLCNIAEVQVKGYGFKILIKQYSPLIWVGISALRNFGPNLAAEHPMKITDPRCSRMFVLIKGNKIAFKI
jgi:hypothetical protein